jgi:hypothetical protein
MTTRTGAAYAELQLLTLGARRPVSLGRINVQIDPRDYGRIDLSRLSWDVEVVPDVGSV